VSERIDKKELLNRVSLRLGRDPDIVSEVIEATLEEIYQALKRGECVSLRDFGTFYVRPERQSWVFKFNPAQRLRRLFGWASTYKGEL
jgi:DNA-binding protein HU-beta